MRAHFTVQDVIDANLCIGCGACAYKVKKIEIGFNQNGELSASIREPLSNAELFSASEVCPFSSMASNETELAANAFGVEGLKLNDVLGRYRSLFAGYSEEFRAYGSSGGILTWLSQHLLTSGKVDYVVCVGKGHGDNARFFSYQVVNSKEAIAKSGTSFYYPVSLDEALEFIRNNPGRYAVTGVPCFHKAIRLIRKNDSVIDDRIVYQLGVVCGQMKSSHYLEYLARKSGVEGKLENACFRRKDSQSRADDYLFEAKYQDANGRIRIATVKNSKIGANWGMGYFKPDACDHCDDVFAETADIAVMDAWLPKYVNDAAGTSLIITRSTEVDKLLNEGKSGGELVLDNETEGMLIESQRGGLNHRRAALRYRLKIAKSRLPRKRVYGADTLSVFDKLDQRARIWLKSESKKAIRLQIERSGGLEYFDNRMKIPLFVFKLINKIKVRFSKRDYTNQFFLGKVEDN